MDTVKDIADLLSTWLDIRYVVAAVVALLVLWVLWAVLAEEEIASD